MVILESSVFTKQLLNLFSDEEYQQLQLELIRRPDLGVVIPGSGGLRKMRWALPGRGKRGGARIIYSYPEKFWPSGARSSGKKGSQDSGKGVS